DACARGWQLPPGVECHPQLHRRWLPAAAAGPARPRARAAVDVLRAVQPRAVHCGGTLDHALPATGFTGTKGAAAAARARLPGVERDGAAPGARAVLRRRAL